eukprot:TRINITY_DN37601_c0_g1_i1.p1 TRINITY_DN37601_c0_g1~~TRINITY_DN37601_c0_g1_i1.p1  ORF type:complete len:273 (+),score=16.54 TRINITY_DN37601_c0_g1_i1:81-821(+)
MKAILVRFGHRDPDFGVRRLSLSGDPTFDEYISALSKRLSDLNHPLRYVDLKTAEHAYEVGGDAVFQDMDIPKQLYLIDTTDDLGDAFSDSQGVGIHHSIPTLSVVVKVDPASAATSRNRAAAIRSPGDAGTSAAGHVPQYPPASAASTGAPPAGLAPQGHRLNDRGASVANADPAMAEPPASWVLRGLIAAQEDMFPPLYAHASYTKCVLFDEPSSPAGGRSAEPSAVSQGSPGLGQPRHGGISA